MSTTGPEQQPGRPQPYPQQPPGPYPGTEQQPGYYGMPAPYPPYQRFPGPVGNVRSTGVCILLFVVTFGIYGYVWFYKVHDEMKRHSGNGLGGGIALVLALFVGIVMPYITSSEIGELYDAQGGERPVSGATGLWYFPGMFILVGPLVWFVLTNNALNDYWRALEEAAP